MTEFTFEGKPMTPELKEVFGSFGEPIGLWVHSDGTIEVSYQIGTIKYVPVPK